MRNRILFPFYKPRCKALTGPKLTNSKSQVRCRASNGYRLEPMQPNPAAASSDGAAEASLGRAVMASPSICDESLLLRPEQLALVDLHEITRGGGFQNDQVIETGRGGQGGRKTSFKGFSRIPTKVSKTNGPDRSEWPD